MSGIEILNYDKTLILTHSRYACVCVGGEFPSERVYCRTEEVSPLLSEAGFLSQYCRSYPLVWNRNLKSFLENSFRN